MFDPRPIMHFIPLWPLVASVIIAFFGPRSLRGLSHWPCIVAALLSCALSVWVLLAVHQDGQAIETYYSWFQAGNVKVGFTLRADALSAIMLVTVTFVSSLIAIYSAGYMHGDEGYPRYFAEISLFIFSMTGLVLADNFIVLYAFWEGVGLCSYLLIGFWFTKPAAAAAARKAFLVTRLGDIGFLIGILLLWSQFRLSGEHLYALDFDTVFEKVQLRGFDGPLTAVCLLLFCGAVGKSAQFPLHVWLPDAMEGPTPVSALIHAATMVTAGVYLVARCTPLFEHAPDAQVMVALIGGLSALLTALVALTQNDLKRVLAYSTISQLGYMFLALGCATRLENGLAGPLVTIAVVAAIFHLFTHAFFKALLFLSAGSVMHAMGGVIDMRRLGGLRFALKWTHRTFLCGAAALAGFPVLSGFWSKDEILKATLEASGEGHPYPWVYFTLFIVALITAGLTAFYTFRAYFLTFWGELRIPHEAGEHAHESPRVMLIPLIILAAGALLAGFVNAEPFTDWFGRFLQQTWHLRPSTHAVEAGGERYIVILGGTAFALGGILVAAWMYLLRPGVAAAFSSRLQTLYQVFLNKFYLDEIYDFFLVRPVLAFARFCRGFDLNVLDQSIVDHVAQIPRLIGLVFRGIQNGLTQFYALAMAGGLAVFVVALLLTLAWKIGW
jgi:proton-translocating NADH-quinone oxidoreductase chain L